MTLVSHTMILYLSHEISKCQAVNTKINDLAVF